MSEKKIDVLKHILLGEDRVEIDILKSRIIELEKLLEEKSKLSKKIAPIINEKLDRYTEEIPEQLGPVIIESLKNEIESSKEQVVDILYPILGRMIKKYIQNEFQMLSNKINTQIQNRFSFKNWFRKVKSKTTGISEEDLIIQGIASTEIHEVFIIERDSGLLIANYSKTKTIDKDVLSGMLTAIKSFVENAFNTSKDHLESIEYGLYNIHLQNFKSYYIAVVVHGVFDITYQNKLENTLLDFSKDYLAKHKAEISISEALEKIFVNDID